MKVGDIVKPRVRADGMFTDEYRYGVILDSYEDDYGIVYYEIHWMSDQEWWKEDELRLVSDGNK